MDWSLLISAVALLVALASARYTRRSSLINKAEHERNTEVAAPVVRAAGSSEHPGHIGVWNDGTTPIEDVQAEFWADNNATRFAVEVADELPARSGPVYVDLPKAFVGVGRDENVQRGLEMVIHYRTPKGNPRSTEKFGVRVLLHRAAS